MINDDNGEDGVDNDDDDDGGGGGEANWGHYGKGNDYDNGNHADDVNSIQFIHLFIISSI